MTTGLIIGLVFFIFVILIAAVYLLWRPTQMDNIQALMRNARTTGNINEKLKEASTDKEDYDERFQELKKEHKKTFFANAKPKETEEERFFKAGFFSKKQQTDFKRFRLAMPLVFGTIFCVLATKMGGTQLGMMGFGIGGIIGYIAPSFYLDRVINNRSDEIMYYLPLVIEQLAIGVSSSLDIGPCVQNVVQMADERDTHNVVTELFKHCEQYMKSGVSLQESLVEIGKRSGHNELKHSFMALAQVARHGGEISRQLQELAEAVQKQRETQIEAKIKKLELIATGPVAFVFFGFMIILMAGFGIQVKNALG